MFNTDNLIIIPGYDISEYFQARLFFCFEFSAMNQLGIESLEKIFGDRVIPAISFPAHALYPLEMFQQIKRLSAGILNPPFRMKNHPPVGIGLFARLCESTKTI